MNQNDRHARLVAIVEKYMERSRGFDPQSAEPRSHGYAMLLLMASAYGGSAFGVWDSVAEVEKLNEFKKLSKKLLACFAGLAPYVKSALNEEMRKAGKSEKLPMNPAEFGIYYSLYLLGELADDAIKNSIQFANTGESPGRQNWRAAAIYDMCREVWFWNFKKHAPRWTNADSTKPSRGKFADFADEVLRECGETVTSRSAARVLIENVSSYRRKTDKTG